MRHGGRDAAEITRVRFPAVLPKGNAMQPTRWAMVGTGLMLDLIGRDVALTENAELRVIVSRTQARAEAAAQKFGIPEGSGNFDAVLRRDDIDVVYIATPHTEHLRQALAALEAGKHVLVEKPMTNCAADTRLLCATAAATGRFAMEAMWMAFNPAIVEARRRIADGAIGEPLLLHANFCFAMPYLPDWRMWAKELAGGSTLDQGVYTSSLAHMIFGAPSRIAASGTILHDVDAEVATTFDYAAGGRAVCVTSLRASSPLHAYVAGTTGHFEIAGPFWGTGGFAQRGANPDDFTYEREGAGYVPMLRAVGAAITDGLTEHPLRTHADTVAVAETLDEILRQVHG